MKKIANVDFHQLDLYDIDKINFEKFLLFYQILL